MRRLIPLLLAGMAIAMVSACGSGSESNDPETVIPVATPASTATTASGSGLTPISSPVTPVATSTAPSAATPEATATIAAPAPTNIPAGNTPAPTQAIPPTATPVASGGNPLSASVGVTGTARYFWSPASVKIAPGGTVTFAWSGTVPHDLKVPGIGFTADPASNASHTLTFPNPGTYQVVCIIHEDTMKGTVTVQ